MRRRGAVASESAICSKIGRDTIAMGGSAADAMVSTTLCVGVIGMYHSGIGGGGFMLVRDKNGNYETIDYRETAPAAASQDMYKHDQNASVYGGLAVAVPTRITTHSWSTTRSGLRILPPMVRRQTHNSLEKIANQGIDVFYKGEIGELALRHRVKPSTDLAAKAESMVSYIQEMNGIVTMEDLDAYTVNVKPALNITYGDYRLFATEAPSSGAVTFSMFKTMQQYAPEDLADINLTTHRFVEAMKFAYAARLELGDPAFVKNASQIEAFLLSDDTAEDIRSRIFDDRTQPVEAYDPLSLFVPDSHGTSHVVASDESGLTISSTTTINLLFGAQIMTPDTGIILGRTGTEAKILARGMSLHDAVAAPRLHHQLLPHVLRVEEGYDAAVVASLEGKGHEIEYMAPGLSAVQGVMRFWDGRFDAVGEPRQVNSGGYVV
ncbi:hypothetical protein CHGG_10184 [Chaetomium globosum CBS 148.51]|uniref:Gamma-glutamyltranspeptidase n=1 Tax=Chaetomium globosum (strain ATCC 6205 / CBS 148.51 / DSM 1962 / NBRC 6347 / NRRL 1970) TaxID=306901 RepID=Q2GPC0_CHAGB|nr:uncharacterized protein CHGG_10184 [Chaetomium globosum CBS 148.51]EAQ83780.1 hypothetical protein CHGG_10184 [Chaetomium globosum CBS 148.51]